MEKIRTYVIGETEYELYRAASGDYCVTVMKYGEENEDYNLGTLSMAYAFILAYAAGPDGVIEEED